MFCWRALSPPGSDCGSSAGEPRCEPLLERRTRKRTDDPVDLVPVADYDQERDRLGADARSEPGVGVDVDLDDLHPSGVLAGERPRAQVRSSGTVRTTLPEVNDDGHRGARFAGERLGVGVDQPGKLRLASRAAREP